MATCICGADAKQRCSVCKTPYCSKDCQARDFTTHRKTCKPACQDAEGGSTAKHDLGQPVKAAKKAGRSSMPARLRNRLAQSEDNKKNLAERLAAKQAAAAARVTKLRAATVKRAIDTRPTIRPGTPDDGPPSPPCSPCPPVPPSKPQWRQTNQAKKSGQQAPGTVWYTQVAPKVTAKSRKRAAQQRNAVVDKGKAAAGEGNDDEDDDDVFSMFCSSSSRAFWQETQALAISEWTPALLAHSFSTTTVSLSYADCEVLLRVLAPSKEKSKSKDDDSVEEKKKKRFWNKKPKDDLTHVQDIGARIDEAIIRVRADDNSAQGAFVKLDSRSAKDVAFVGTIDRKERYLLRDQLIAYEAVRVRGGEGAESDPADINQQAACVLRACQLSLSVASGKAALAQLASSARVAQDLRKCVRYAEARKRSSRAAMNIMVRAFEPIDPALEFRGFMQRGKLTALSQYFHFVNFPSLAHLSPASVPAAEIQSVPSNLVERIHSFCNEELSPLLPRASCVVDLALLNTGRLIVIELNPFHHTTGPCLFDWKSQPDMALLTQGPFTFRKRDVPDAHACRVNIADKYWREIDSYFIWSRPIPSEPTLPGSLSLDPTLTWAQATAGSTPKQTPSETTVPRGLCAHAVEFAPVAEVGQQQAQPQTQQRLRVVCISDTHGRHRSVAVPPGDVLVHTGDFTTTGQREQVQDLHDWLVELPHPHKIVIAGNHDITFEPEFYRKRGGARFHRARICDEEEVRSIKAILQDSKHVVYLEDERHVISIPRPSSSSPLPSASLPPSSSPSSAMGVAVWGAPWQPEFCDWAFNLPRGNACASIWRRIPDDTHILLTHGPPLGRGDRCKREARAGCVDLLSEIQGRLQPGRGENGGHRQGQLALHVCGHVHEGYGVTSDGKTVYVNASSCDVDYVPSQPAIVLDLIFEAPGHGPSHDTDPPLAQCVGVELAQSGVYDWTSAEVAVWLGEQQLLFQQAFALACAGPPPKETSEEPLTAEVETFFKTSAHVMSPAVCAGLEGLDGRHLLELTFKGDDSVTSRIRSAKGMQAIANRAKVVFAIRQLQAQHYR